MTRFALMSGSAKTQLAGARPLLLSLSVSAPLQAQDRAPVGPNVAPYVSVNAPLVALTHVRVVDGTGAPARDDQTIVIRGTMIGTVGASATTTVPATAQSIDLSGHTIVPGLVQLHEHT